MIIISAADNLKVIIEQQKEALSELENQYEILVNSDMGKEINELKDELHNLRVALEQSKTNADSLADENKGLRNALYDQVFSDKIGIINSATQKLDVYFKSGIDVEKNKLADLEQRVKARLDEQKKTLSRNSVSAQEEIYSKIDEISDLLDAKIQEAQELISRIPGAFTQQEREELEALKNEQITNDQILEITKKNNFERFLGLNVINAVGVLLLIVGAITLAHFTYYRLTDVLKGIMLFALGGAMLFTGELLNRKIPNVFSLGISAGGIGILYTALAMSYFALSILDMYPALLICILITAGSVLLSSRYNAQIITVFALVGGYLPLYSIGLDVDLAYGAMIYFFTLNLLVLLISFEKKWRISSFLGLSLNTIGTFYICLLVYRMNTLVGTIISIIFVLLAFIIYTAIPIISTYRTGARFRKTDIVLLAINTVVSSLIMFWVFYIHRLQDYNGLLAVSYAVVYLLLGRLVEKRFTGDEKNAKSLFYITGLAFVIMIIPLQFDRSWLSLGWLAEGVLLSVYGILSNEKNVKRAGFVVFALCILSFTSIDCLNVYHYMFIYKYSAITLGCLGILMAFMHRSTTLEFSVKIYRYFSLTNLWLFCLYLIHIKTRFEIQKLSIETAFDFDYMLSASAIVITFALAYAYARIKRLSDIGTKILSIALYAIGIIHLTVINSYMSPVAMAYFRKGTPGIGTTIAGTAILIVLCLLSIVALRDLVLLILTQRKIGIEWFPMIISGYSVIILTQNLISHYNLSFSSAAISIIYVLTALGWIIFGFARRYSFIRKFGLALALLSVIKLFLLDLASLTQGYLIITYFALGLTLLAISFVYQYFNKRLELREEVSIDA